MNVIDFLKEHSEMFSVPSITEVLHYGLQDDSWFGGVPWDKRIRLAMDLINREGVDPIEAISLLRLEEYVGTIQEAAGLLGLSGDIKGIVVYFSLALKLTGNERRFVKDHLLEPEFGGNWFTDLLSIYYHGFWSIIHTFGNILENWDRVFSKPLPEVRPRSISRVFSIWVQGSPWKEFPIFFTSKKKLEEFLDVSDFSIVDVPESLAITFLQVGDPIFYEGKVRVLEISKIRKDSILLDLGSPDLKEYGFDPIEYCLLQRRLLL